jgi:sulfite reductase (NADPH) flavoprotein alpha-component
LLCCDGEEATPGDAETPLRLAFLKKFDLQKPSQEFLAALAHHAPGSPVASLLAPEAAQQLRDYLFGRDLRDLLALSETAWRPEELVPLLKKLQPRLYSISSSPLAHPGEVHLTVAAVRYHAHNRNRKGVCSTFLADRVSPDGSVPVFVQPSHGFRLPSDSNVPVIMVGPGTGIAPFRAFLEEREATGATGRNWLFFGAQHQSTDFLYREQLESWSASGHLNRLSLAFSRDQVEKIYVQHRMLEQGADLWAWLQEGAHFYVCGDASRMAKDVDAALLSIAETHGGLPKEAATEYLQELRTRKRYQRDVY